MISKESGFSLVNTLITIIITAIIMYGAATSVANTATRSSIINSSRHIERMVNAVISLSAISGNTFSISNSNNSLNVSGGGDNIPWRTVRYPDGVSLNISSSSPNKIDLYKGGVSGPSAINLFSNLMNCKISVSIRGGVKRSCNDN